MTSTSVLASLIEMGFQRIITELFDTLNGFIEKAEPGGQQV